MGVLLTRVILGLDTKRDVLIYDLNSCGTTREALSVVNGGNLIEGEIQSVCEICNIILSCTLTR